MERVPFLEAFHYGFCFPEMVILRHFLSCLFSLKPFVNVCKQKHKKGRLGQSRSALPITVYVLYSVRVYSVADFFSRVLNLFSPRNIVSAVFLGILSYSVQRQRQLLASPPSIPSCL